MVNLIQNENMKIYRRARTWVMIGILVAIVGIVSAVTWYYDGRNLQGDEWRAQLEEQIKWNEQAMEGLSEDDKAYFTKEIAAAQYSLDHDIRPLDATMWGPILNLSEAVALITLFVVVVAGDSLAGEFSTGTIKLLLIRPASRTKILLSKYVACLLYGILLLIVLFAASLIFYGSFYGFSGWDQPYLSVTDNGAVTEKSVVLHLWGSYLLEAVSTVMYVTMAFMISAVFRSSAMAIGISIFSMYAGMIVTMVLSRYEWSKYILFANLDLSSYLNNSPFKEGMTMGFSISVLFVYFAVFNLLSWFVFTRRDVAA